ncbi:MAG: hypothetical protein ACLQFI_02320 [Methylocella sp.]
MSKCTIAGISVAVTFGSLGIAFAQSNSDQTVTINKAVAHCVSVVHNTHAQEDFMQPYYNNFDAFYNPASGSVNNNAQSNGDMKALFVFHKCMTEQGLPLK